MMSTKRWRRPRSTGTLGWARSEEPGATSDERRGRTVPAQTATLKATKQILGEALVNIHPSENRRQEQRACCHLRVYLRTTHAHAPKHIPDTAPDTASCDSGHRPSAIEHRIIGRYNDLREPSSSTCFSRHRAAVGGVSCCRLCAPRSHAYSRRSGLLSSHGPALRADHNAREPFVLPSSRSP